MGVVSSRDLIRTAVEKKSEGTGCCHLLLLGDIMSLNVQQPVLQRKVPSLPAKLGPRYEGKYEACKKHVTSM